MATSKTDIVINELVSDLPNSPESERFAFKTAARWLTAFLAVGLLTFLAASAFPDRIQLPSLLSAEFLARTSLWMAIFFALAYSSFCLAVPCARARKPILIASICAFLLVAAVWWNTSPIEFLTNLSAECDFGQGPCGLFIGLTGLLRGGAILASMRRAAPIRRSLTGACTLAAAGCMSSFFIQLVCRHESAAHVLIWHVIPVLVLVALGSKLSGLLLSSDL